MSKTKEILKTILSNQELIMKALNIPVPEKKSIAEKSSSKNEQVTDPILKKSIIKIKPKKSIVKKAPVKKTGGKK